MANKNSNCLLPLAHPAQAIEKSLRDKFRDSLQENICLTRDEEAHLHGRRTIGGQVHDVAVYKSVIIQRASGDSLRQIARDLNLCHSSVQKIVNDEKISRIVERLREELLKKLEYHVPIGSRFGRIIYCESGYRQAIKQGDLKSAARFVQLADQMQEGRKLKIDHTEKREVNLVVRMNELAGRIEQENRR